ncbi:MAG: hypothetical protein ACLUKQ_09095 [Peptococcaceae bacterium]
MKLQNLLFPEAGVCSETALYMRKKEDVDFFAHKKMLIFSKNAICTFDTYFNSFSVEKWKKYTKINEILLVLKLKGNFEVTLLSKEKIHDTVVEKVISIHHISCEDLTMVKLPFHIFEWKGMLFFKLKALSDSSEYYGGWYENPIDEAQLREVDLAINICTFKREAFVLKNLEILNENILNNEKNELSKHLQIFISDNGQTLNIESLNTDKIHIVKNKNVGGVGGFTRGLIEIMKYQNKFPATHALMMDDDIVIEIESLYRTYSLLRCMKDEYREAFIGGAMLRLDRQRIQVESGAVWNAGSLVSLKGGLDLGQVDACLYNETEEYAEYNAWWYCCTPMSIVNETNLPLPIFIRGDDLEYGLRNTKHLILLNGICVWHEPFENKYSSFLNYYILRNLLYDNALHCPNYSKWDFLKRLYKTVIRELTYYRYKNVELLFKGVEDFYKGVKFLENTDAENLHKEIMNMGYKAVPVEQLDMRFSYPMYQKNLQKQEGRIKRLRRFATLNGLLLPAKYTVITSMALCRPINFYRAKRVMQYDVASKKAFLVERDRKRTVQLLQELLKLTLKTLTVYDCKIQDFRKNVGKVTNIDFWEKYLEMR